MVQDRSVQEGAWQSRMHRAADQVVRNAIRYGVLTGHPGVDEGTLRAATRRAITRSTLNRERYLLRVKSDYAYIDAECRAARGSDDGGEA